MLSKEQCRERFGELATSGEAVQASGRMAEQLRRLPGYRDCRRIFATPALVLRQARINALVDGKELLMPGPGLKEGFWLLQPFQVPFPKLGYAVTPKGMLEHGRRVAVEELAQEPVGLLLTDLMAVDHGGGFVGDGHGFFDLAVSLLARFGAVTAGAQAIGFGLQGQVLDEPLQLDPWDVRLNRLITEAGLIECGDRDPAASQICWERLLAARIRKVTPLWKCAQLEGRSAAEKG